jgi:MFS family permease
VRNFGRFWAAQAASALGSQITLLALPLTAIGVLDAGPLEVGVLTAVSAIPSLLLGLWIGAPIDRMRKRPIMVAADIGRFVLLLAVPALALAGGLELWHLFAVAFGVALLGLLFDLAAASFLPALVGRERLVEANSRLELSNAGAQVAGPGLAGLLVQALTAPIAIAADAFSFLVSALLVGVTRNPRDSAVPAEERRSILADVRAGIGLVASDPILRPLVGTTATGVFFSQAIEAIALLYLVSELGLEPAIIGIVFSIGNLGVLGAAVGVRRLAERIGAGRALTIAVAGIVSADAVVPLLGFVPDPERNGAPIVAALVASQLLFGLAVTSYTIISGTMRQVVTPDPMRSRVAGTTRFLVTGISPLGAIVGGVLGELIGLQGALFVAVAGELLAVAWLLLSAVPTVRSLGGDVASRPATTRLG